MTATYFGIYQNTMNSPQNTKIPPTKENKNILKHPTKVKKAVPVVHSTKVKKKVTVCITCFLKIEILVITLKSATEK